MQFPPGYVIARIAILAIVFVGASLAALAVVRSVAPATPPIKATAGNLITRGHHPLAGRTKTYHPEKRNQIEPQLYPAVVKVSSPRKVRLGDAGRISLKIEPDRKLKVEFPKPGDQLTLVRNEEAEEETVRTYHTLVSDQVMSNLYPSSSDQPMTPREGNPQVLIREGAAWTWHVPATDPGARALDLELLAYVKIDNDQHRYQVGLLGLEIPVDSGGMPGFLYRAKEVVGLWQGAVMLASGLVALAGAIPIVLKLFPARRRKDAPEAQKPA
jgi:hypothetical protein